MIMKTPEIQSYSFGSMRIDGEEYGADLIILPDGVQENWRRDRGHRLALADLDAVLEHEPNVENLVIGQGGSGRMKVPGEVETELASRGIQVYSAPTGEAVTKYNSLRTSSRTAGAFHLTC
jgi:hypothetical protein